MGGHGALISFFKCPGQYRSVSAFAPICSTLDCQWSRNAFQKFLGEGLKTQIPIKKKLFFLDEELWKEYDACELVRTYQGPIPSTPILIDQGSEDEYKNDYLFPKKFVDACTNASFPIQYREQIGYNHGCFFLMTFLEDHFKYHQNEFEQSNEIKRMDDLETI